MDLKKYDGKYIRLTDIQGICYDGECYYNTSEFNECEYGRFEDSLDILNFKFYSSCIKDISELKDFSDSEYGNLEKLIVHEGFEFIEDAFDYGNKKHIKRLILCINDCIDTLVDKDKILDFLCKYYDK